MHVHGGIDRQAMQDNCHIFDPMALLCDKDRYLHMLHPQTIHPNPPCQVVTIDLGGISTPKATKMRYLIVSAAGLPSLEVARAQSPQLGASRV